MSNNNNNRLREISTYEFVDGVIRARSRCDSGPKYVTNFDYVQSRTLWIELPSVIPDMTQADYDGYCDFLFIQVAERLREEFGWGQALTYNASREIRGTQLVLSVRDVTLPCRINCRHICVIMLRHGPFMDRNLNAMIAKALWETRGTAAAWNWVD
jgi:hypothetical protein